MAAEILELADSIADELQILIGGIVATVERVYQINIDLSTVVGKKIYIFPAAYSDEGPADRATDYFDSRLIFVTLERCEDDLVDGLVPKEWVDKRVEFVEANVFNTFTNSRRLYGPNSVWWAQSVETTSVFDFTRLDEHKTFWSEIEIVFRRLKS